MLNLPPTLEIQLTQTAQHEGLSASDFVKKLLDEHLNRKQALVKIENPFNFDLEKMQKAVESPSISVPKSAMQDVDSLEKWVRANFV